MRAGDTVKHRPTGETWTVAYVDGDKLAWCGWPEGEANVSDCDLVESCSDDQHRKMLDLWARNTARDHVGFADRRHSICLRQLEQIASQT